MSSKVYVCISDRFTWKLDIWKWNFQQTHHCPLCGQPGLKMGQKWRAPKKSDDKSWKLIEQGHLWWENPLPKPKPIVKFVTRSRGRGKIVRID